MPQRLPDDDRVDTAYRLIIQASNAARIKVPNITDSEIREARELACDSIVDAKYGLVDL
jgi:hypothetical protein